MQERLEVLMRLISSLNQILNHDNNSQNKNNQIPDIWNIDTNKVYMNREFRIGN
jgi:hypothetical protein